MSLEHLKDPARRRVMRTRRDIEMGVRRFFDEKGFLETPTPTLVTCPGTEAHLRAFQVNSAEDPKFNRFLPTSPELSMKKLIASGVPELQRIYQIAPAFRDEPDSPTHLPEFLMLEWYRAEASLEDLMSDVEDLVCELSRKILGEEKIRFENQNMILERPWKRKTVNELFQESLDLDLRHAKREDLVQTCKRIGIPPADSDSWDDLFFKLWLNKVEPGLPKNLPVFVSDYPASQAALAEIKEENGHSWADRFEVFMGGIELANAFQELRSAEENLARYEKEMLERSQGSKALVTPMDQELIQILKVQPLPKCAGIALGLSRLIQLLANEPDISKTVWLPSR